MTITPEQIRERLDRMAIDLAAAEMADRLRDAPGWHMTLTPGDGTLYQIAVVGRMLWRPQRSSNWVQDGWMVANQFAGLYPWNGQRVHDDYALEKWGGGSLWTAVVMSEFLTCLSKRLAALREGGS